MHSRLFCFGLGYSAEVLVRRLLVDSWSVAGTARHDDRLAALVVLGVTPYAFDRDRPLPAGALAGATHLLVSVPPDQQGDPVLDGCAAAIAAAAATLRWIGYLSTTGVYGNHDGGLVDETTPPAPTSDRARRRVAAEVAWLAFGERHGLAVHLFRLAGIYGPGRSAVDEVRAGTARRILRPGQLFSRIHVADIASVLQASMARPRPGAIYNVCDDAPAAPAEVIGFACDLLGVPPPPEVPFESAALSPMAQTFWADNKRVSNRRIKDELGVALAFPTYREGLQAIVDAEATSGPSSLSG
jgi:nucleoside-diphosphate-sugar epimerase